MTVIKSGCQMCGCCVTDDSIIERIDELKYKLKFITEPTTYAKVIGMIDAYNSVIGIVDWETYEMVE